MHTSEMILDALSWIIKFPKVPFCTSLIENSSCTSVINHSLPIIRKKKCLYYIGQDEIVVISSNFTTWLVVLLTFEFGRANGLIFWSVRSVNRCVIPPGHGEESRDDWFTGHPDGTFPTFITKMCLSANDPPYNSVSISFVNDREMS